VGLRLIVLVSVLVQLACDGASALDHEKMPLLWSLKSRVVQELRQHPIFDMISRDQSSSDEIPRSESAEQFLARQQRNITRDSRNEILSCCLKPFADIRFHRSSFEKALTKTLRDLGNSSSTQQTRMPIVHLDVGHYDKPPKRYQPEYGDYHLSERARSPRAFLRKLRELESTPSGKKLLGGTRFVLLSSGYGCNGSPFFGLGISSWACMIQKEEREAALQLLKNPRIASWWVNNHESSFEHYKLRYHPLGAIQHCCPRPNAAKARRSLRHAHEEKLTHHNSTDSPTVFQSLLLGSVPKLRKSRHRKRVIVAMERLIPGLKNRIGLELDEYYSLVARAALVVSPAGLASDCYRHYQALLAGAPVLVDAHHSLKEILAGLPVMRVSDWDELSVKMINEWASTALRRARPFRWEKLGMDFWKNEIVKSSFRN